MAVSGIRRIRIRFANTCVVCGEHVPKGVEGWHDPVRKVIACGTHDVTELKRPDETAPPDTSSTIPLPAPPRPPPPPPASEPHIAAPAVGARVGALPKLISAKFDSTCTVCGNTVLEGHDVFWVVGTRVVVCPPCTAGEVAAGLDPGTAGGSAARIADGVARKHAERLLAAYPMLGEHLIANARPTASMHAWMRGADGERLVGRRLDVAAEEGRIVVLHDRRLPFGGNIDHLVIGPRRISVVDAKHYRGARIKKVDDRLTIGGEDAEHLIDGARRQRAAICDALADRPRIAANVQALLVFVSGDFGLMGPMFQRGVYCTHLKDVVPHVAWRGPVLGGNTIKLDADERQEIAEKLAISFPEA